MAKRRVANAVANRVVFFLVAARRTAALQHTECARNRAQCSPWSMAVSGSCPKLAPHAKFSTSCCVRRELQTTAKPRTVGRVSGGQFARTRRVAREFVPNAEAVPRGR